MTTLREDAIKAAAADENAFEQAQRDHLAQVLASASVTGLRLTDTQRLPSVEVAVFTDGDLCLAVRRYAQGETWEVALVESDEMGGWTTLGAVTSLASLGELLDGRNT